jgi:hypothetical protein
MSPLSRPGDPHRDGQPESEVAYPLPDDADGLQPIRNGKRSSLGYLLSALAQVRSLLNERRIVVGRGHEAVLSTKAATPRAANHRATSVPSLSIIRKWNPPPGQTTR